MAEASQLASLLEDVERHSGLTEEALIRFRGFSKGCTACAVTGLPLPDADRPALRSTLVTAGSRLGQLGAQLLRDLDKVEMEFEQCWLALNRIAATICLAQAGAALCRLLADAEVSQAIQRSVALLLGCGQLVLQGSTMFRAAAAQPAAQLLAQQLRLMVDLWVLDPAHMASLAPPEKLLPWLSAAVDVAVAVTRPGAPPPIECLAPLAQLAATLLPRDPSWPADGSKQALQQEPALAARLVAVLEPGLPAAAVALALPAQQRPEGFTWQLVSDLSCVLTASQLHNALQKHLGMTASSGGSSGSGSSSSGGDLSSAAQRLLSAATRLLELAVQRQAEETEAETHGMLLRSCSLLLGFVCGHVYDAAEAQQGDTRWLGEQQLSMVRTVKQAVAQLLVVLRLVSASSPEQPSPPRQQRQRGEAQQDEPTEQRPGGSLAEWADEAATVCNYLTNVPTLLYALCFRGSGPSRLQQGAPREPPPLLASLADVPDWCAAAVAALRLLPHCAALADATQRRELRANVASIRKHNPNMLAATSLTVAVHTALACEACVRGTLFAPTATAEAVHAAHDALWQLHSAFCRLADWLAAGGGSSLPGLQRQRLELRYCRDCEVAVCSCSPFMAQTVSSICRHLPFHHPLMPRRSCHPRSTRTCRAWHALAAATWVALQALAAGQEAQLLQQPQLCLKLASCLVDVAASGPVAVAGSPELLHLLQAALHGAPQGLGADEDVRQAALKAAASSPRLCAGMLSTGLLGSILEAEQAASASGPRGRRGTSQPFGEAQWLVEPLGCLLMEGSHVGMNADSGGGSQDSAASAGGGPAAEAGEDEDAQACRLQVQRAATALDSACTHQLGRTQHGRLDLPAMLRRLLPPAEALAAALQEWHGLPEGRLACRPPQGVR
ncbi:hypothetical protein ABPG75_002783 [Micractinium tetrahymenae]